MVGLNKEYTHAEVNLAHAVAVVIPDSVFFCDRIQHNIFRKNVSVLTWIMIFSDGKRFAFHSNGVQLFQHCIFVQPLRFDIKRAKNGIYCTMRSTQQQGEEKSFPKPIDSNNTFDILNSEAGEHLFYCFLPSDSFLDNRIKK